MKHDIIDLAYEIAKKKYKKGKFKYRSLLAEVIKSDPKLKDMGGDLYIELINDIRFLSLGNDDWALQEYYSYDEFEKIAAAMFGLDKIDIDPELLEEMEIEKPVIAVDEDGILEVDFDSKEKDIELKEEEEDILTEINNEVIDEIVDEIEDIDKEIEEEE
ncbi:MAG: DNA-directed RNA polymerase subunit delta [Mycoplasmoidaceae bacterium]